jgi:hypothetical protein
MGDEELKPVDLSNDSTSSLQDRVIGDRAESGAVGAADPLLAWLDACPVTLSDQHRLSIISIVKATQAESTR